MFSQNDCDFGERHTNTNERKWGKNDDDDVDRNAQNNIQITRVIQKLEDKWKICATAWSFSFLCMAGPLAFGMQITAYQLDVCVAI